MDKIEKIRETHGIRYEPVTKEDRDMIVRAIGLTRGHWFKCPKGERIILLEALYFSRRLYSYYTTYSNYKRIMKDLLGINFLLSIST